MLRRPVAVLAEQHFGAESIQRPWLNTEGLPEHRTDEHEVLVDKWIAATGKVPE